MIVVPTPNNFLKVHGVPDYYAVYLRWIKHYEETNQNKSKTLAYHYARVAEEMGQATVDDSDDDTIELTS